MIELDDTVTVGGVGEGQPEDLGVLLSLLKPFGGMLVFGFGFDDGKREIAGIAQEVVGELALAAPRALAGDDDATVGEVVLLHHPIAGPAGRGQFREDVGPAGVGFVHECGPMSRCGPFYDVPRD
jgi:hypothetical protein